MGVLEVALIVGLLVIVLLGLSTPRRDGITRHPYGEEHSERNWR